MLQKYNLFKKYNLSIKPWEEVTALGSMTLYGLLLLVVLALQEYSLFWDLLWGVAITYVICLGIRLLYFKHRPKQRQYRNIIERLDAASFPSIHASRVSFLALHFSTYTGSWLLSIVLSLLALLVFYSRITLQMHDWKDISGGVIVGVLGYFLVLLL